MIKSNFYTTLFLPVSQKFVKIKEINNFYYLDILKFLQNNSYNDLLSFFDQCINDLTDISPSDLSNLDKFCILLEMRSASIGNVIEFFAENTQIKYNLFDICKNIQNLKIDYNEINIGNLKFKIGIPNNFLLDSNDDIFLKCILKINDLDLNYLTDHEKISLYESIPASIYNDIKEYILKYISYIEDKNIFNIDILESFKNFKLNPFNNSLFEFIKTIYNDNLKNFYELQFNLITKLNISYDHFMSMTFNEARMYVALQNNEIKKQEEAQKKTNSNFSL
jgi:hypothetical protein